LYALQENTIPFKEKTIRLVRKIEISKKMEFNTILNVCVDRKYGNIKKEIVGSKIMGTFSRSCGKSHLSFGDQ
jgi:hypothetical protein